MIQYRNHKGERFSAITEITEKHGVNGEKSISGHVYKNDDVIHGLGRGWRFNFQGEEYVVVYAAPIDEGNNVTLEFDAVHEFFYEMQKSVIKSSRSGSHTMRSYLDFIFNGIDFSYSLEVNVPAFEKENFGYKNRLDLFHDIINQTGLEYSVTGRAVRILRRMGDDLTTVVRKRLNMHDLRIEKNIGGFITRQSGFGAWVDDEDHSKGRLTVTYTSPLAEEFGILEGDPVVDERYSIEENLMSRLEKNVENSYNISVELTMEDLTKAGYEYRQPRNGDKIMAINEELGFKRQVRIVSYESEYDIKGTLLSHKVTCSSLSSRSKTLDSNMRTQLNKALERSEKAFQEAKLANENATQAMASADGTKRNFYGADDPTELYEIREGDIWFDSSGEIVIARYWNGYEWIILVDEDAIQREIDAAKSQLEEFEKDLTTTSELANDVNNKASQLEQSYQDVKASTDSAMNKAVDAYTDAQSALAGIDGLVYENRNLLKNSKERTLTPKNAGTRYDNFNYMILNYPTIEGQTYTISADVEITAGSASHISVLVNFRNTGPSNQSVPIENGKITRTYVAHDTTDSNTVLLYAGVSGETRGNGIIFRNIKIEKGTKATPYSVASEDLNEEISNAWRVANEALTDVDNLDQSVQQEFTNINGQLSSKAEQTTVNELNRTVQNQGSEILQAQKMIALKADRTDVDTLNKIIKTNSAELSVLADEIGSKVDKQTVDNLNQTVENLSAEQIIQADKISERLTRSEVNAEIERRVNDMAGGEFNLEGYAEVEYVENLIENTADSFSQSIESVKKLVPTSYENRNLYQQSRTRHGWRTDQYSLYFEEDVAVSEWGATDAIRLRLTQGGSDARAAYNVIRLLSDPLYEAGDDYIVSGYIKNNTAGNTIFMRSHGNGSAQVRVSAGDAKYFEIPVKLAGSSLMIGLHPALAGNDVDVSLWNIKVEKGTVATDWSPAPEDLENEVTILRSDYERTAEEVTDRLTKIDGSNGYISEIRRDVGSLTSSITEYEEGTAQRFNVIESDVNSNKSLIADLEKDTESRFSQTDEEMSLLVRSSDLISEINLQADRQIFRVGDNRLMITEDTTYLDNAVIKSAHIADLAVTGAKIADASISSAKIISLDADQITGNTTKFIQSSWNSINGWMTATGNGIEMVGDNQWRRNILTATGIELYDRSGASNKAGVIGYLVPHNLRLPREINSWITTRIGPPKHGIGIVANYHHDVVLGYEMDEDGGNVYWPALEVRGNTGDVDISTRLIMKNGGNIIDVNTLKYKQLNTEIGTWEGSLTYRANRHHRFFSSNNQELFNVLDNGYANLYARLNMHGNDVYNQSDERLKRNIMPSFKDSLGKFSKLEFKWYEYLENRGLADGLHHGLIAQDVVKFAPEWVVEDEQGYYSLNQTAMLMDAFKAIMQLSQKVKKLEAK